MIKAIPTSRGMNSCLDQHSCQSRPSCAPSGPALGSGPTLVLIPDLVLPSWLVLSIYAADWDPIGSNNKYQSLLNKLMDWCYVNKLTIKIGKTKQICIPRYRNQLDMTKGKTVDIKDEKLNNVISYKYLGLDLEQSLRFDSMLDKTYNKANHKLYSLKNNHPYVTSSIGSLIYKTCIRPLMDFADFLVDSYNKVSTDKRERIRKRAVKIIDQARHKALNHNDLLDVYGI